MLMVEFQRKTLTIDSNRDILLFGIFTTADAARVQALVWTLELRDGQNIVEQHVRSVFHDPLGSEAGVAILQFWREEEPKG